MLAPLLHETAHVVDPRKVAERISTINDYISGYLLTAGHTKATIQTTLKVNVRAHTHTKLFSIYVKITWWQEKQNLRYIVAGPIALGGEDVRHVVVDDNPPEKRENAPSVSIKVDSAQMPTSQRASIAMQGAVNNNGLEPKH